ncbi:MAG: DoxX family protein [Calditrichia bacterium]
MTANKISFYGSWLLQIILGLLFLAAGAGKFLAAEVWIAKFSSWGFPQHFYLLIGLVELAAAVLLFIPRLFNYAIITLTAIMLGAVLTHLVHQEFAEIIRPIVFLLFLSFLFFLKKKQGG